MSLISTENTEGSNNCELCIIFMSTLESEISNKDTEVSRYTYLIIITKFNYN